MEIWHIYRRGVAVDYDAAKTRLSAWLWLALSTGLMWIPVSRARTVIEPTEAVENTAPAGVEFSVESLAYSLAAFFMSAIFVKALKRPAHILGLIDRPSARKSHQGAIPLTGGLAIFLSFSLVSILGDHITPTDLLAGTATLLVVGLFDDRYQLSPKVRLAWEVIAALVMVYLGHQVVTDMGNFAGFGRLSLKALSVPFTVLCTVGLINAINMSDGLDGLGGGIVLVALVWLTLAAVLAAVPVPTCLFVLSSGLIGFLSFNMPTPWRKKAVVFLGDSGSMLLGFTLAWFAIHFAQGPDRALSPIATAWVLALPVIDTMTLMLRRILRGQSPFSGDRSHMHHILERSGFKQSETTAILLGVSACLGAVGVLGYRLGIPDYWMTLGFLSLFLVHWVVLKHAWWIAKFLKKRETKNENVFVSSLPSGDRNSEIAQSNPAE